MNNNLMDKISETAVFLNQYIDEAPKIAIVLGSGLGNFTSQIEVELEIEYHKIPNFPVSTVEGHSGKLVFGTVAGKKIVAMAGRFHYYEGYSPEDVVFPIRVFKYIGVETLLLSNAAGAVNAAYKVGDLMIIKDHISFFTPNPLVGKNYNELGPRFPDMSEPYSSKLIAKAKTIAAENNYTVHEGVYVAVTGPTFETRAEYKLILAIGGDVVGMSTVQETIAANHCGLKVFAMSVVTDIGIRDHDDIITHEEVLAAAKAAEPVFTTIFSRLIEDI